MTFGPKRFLTAHAQAKPSLLVLATPTALEGVYSKYYNVATNFELII